MWGRIGIKTAVRPQFSGAGPDHVTTTRHPLHYGPQPSTICCPEETAIPVHVMNKVLAFLKRELLEMLPPTIFFFVVFHITLFTRALMAEQYGIPVASSVAATVAALIVGKSILIADALPLMRRFGQRRLVYNVVWRILLYVTMFLLFQLLEELVPLLSKYGEFSTAAAHMSEEINWPHFWASHTVLVVFLVFYCVGTAVIDAFGRDAVLEVFFKSRTHH